MRTRNRITHNVQTTVAPFSENWVGHGTYTVSAGSGVILDYGTETMNDDISKGRHFKEVKHQKKRLTRQDPGNGTLVSGTETFIQSGPLCFFHVWGLGAHDFVNHDHIPTSYPVSDSQLIRDTLNDFYNSNEVDSLLNVVESPELVTGLSALGRQVANMPLVAGYSLRRSRSGKWSIDQRKISSSLFAQAKKAGGFLSGGYLYYMFGIAPIISDINKIAKNLRKYRKELGKVIEKAGTNVKVHRSVQGSFGAFGTGGRPIPDDYSPSQNTQHRWTSTIYSQDIPKKTCTVDGIRDHKWSSEGLQTLDYLVSRFGAVGPASFLWERIPFSFIVDWFVDLSDVFNRLDNALTGSRKKVRYVSLSEKWSCLCPAIKLQYSSTLTDTRDGQQIALCDLSHYHRQSVDPNLSIGLRDRFGKKQVSILAALATSIGANLRAKR